MKPLVLYHASCADGFGAAFAAWLVLGDDADDMTNKIGPDEHMGLGFYSNDGEQLAFVEGKWPELVDYVEDFIRLNAYPGEKQEGDL